MFSEKEETPDPTPSQGREKGTQVLASLNGLLLESAKLELAIRENLWGLGDGE